MSDVMTALGGASFDGYCKISESNLRGMITLRGDFASAEFADVINAETGMAIPDQRRITHDGARSLAWMSPDELLFMLPYDAAADAAAQLSDALTKQHAMAINVSDARALFRVEGAACREVLAKLAPVDLHPDAFGPGDIRRTRLAQVAGAFWMPDAHGFEVVCFRSVARYVFDLLSESARQGAQTGYPAAV